MYVGRRGNNIRGKKIMACCVCSKNRHSSIYFEFEQLALLPKRYVPDSKFDPDPGYPDIFVVFLSPSRQIAAQQLKTGHLHFSLHPLQFMLNQLPR